MSNKPLSIETTRAARILSRCRELARITDVPGETTRLYLSPATRDAHTLLTWWMRQTGLTARTDDAGNLRATLFSHAEDPPTLILFSHMDTVPNAGAFDGPLGVLLGLAAMEEVVQLTADGMLHLPYNIELIAFAEEEGARFGFPFLSSLAATGQLTPDHLGRADAQGISVAQAMQNFGLNPDNIAQSCPLPANSFAALEVHIEQGPVLESLDLQLAVVETIVGQSRFHLTFTGQANHAGTTPMPLRRDALAAAAQWVVEVERYAANYTQLVATVGHLQAFPGAMNVVPGTVQCSLDVRHPSDASRHAAVAHLLTAAESAAALRNVTVRAQAQSEQRAVPMDRTLTQALHDAAANSGIAAHAMFSGAGHDAMILAPHVPTTMLFLRSPGGLSHHPDEVVREQDVEAALATVLYFLVHLDPAILKLQPLVSK